MIASNFGPISPRLVVIHPWRTDRWRTTSVP